MASTNTPKSEKIKQSILEATSCLFATHSYSNVGLRTVARTAGTTLNTITYHFETKQNLYMKTMEYVFSAEDHVKSLIDMLKSTDSLTQQELSNLIYSIIREIVLSINTDTVQKWRLKLYIRYLLEDNSVIINKAITGFREINNELGRIIKNSGVSITEDHYQELLSGIWGEMVYVELGRDLLKDRFGAEKYDILLLEKFAKSIAKRNIKLLDLPDFEPAE